MEKPILFNTEMVKAILEDRKNTTRRIIKGVEGLDFIGIGIDPKEIENTAAFGHGNFKDIVNAKIEKHIKAPCLPEDILYVRETWTRLYEVDANGYTHWDKETIYYAADGCPDVELRDADGFLEEDQRIKWKASIHMPRKLARIFLKVTDVRVERLQDITEEQIRREGIKEEFPPLARDAFQELWDSTTKEYIWKLNPWVWVIEFERIKK